MHTHLQMAFHYDKLSMFFPRHLSFFELSVDSHFPNAYFTYIMNDLFPMIYIARSTFIVRVTDQTAIDCITAHENARLSEEL